MKKNTYEHLSCAALYEKAIERGEGLLTQDGAFVVCTGKFTGRSAGDKFIVSEASTRDHIWWGSVNHQIEEGSFEKIYERMEAYLGKIGKFIQDCAIGADPKFRRPLRVITEKAWHGLFAKTLFLPLADEKIFGEKGGAYTVICAPGFEADPKSDNTNSSTFIILNFKKRVVLIGGTSYAGEIKKAMFTVMNYLLPREGVLSLHASATVGVKGDSALFFGLSGTGKTSLSADPSRFLVGDDELGWSGDGVFNLEGGCYAKVIRLSPEAEPQIYEATTRFGTILENVVMDKETRAIDLDDASLTENTRAAYTIRSLPNAYAKPVAPHPSHIFMLTCDAFGVLPPLSRLTPEQAVYHFLSGYTAKLAGTERGVEEPQATFSPCFGAPFLPLPPSRYAKLLEEKIAKHKVQCWLVNTGWTGGPVGTGKRIAIAHTRQMIQAATQGLLAGAPLKIHPAFGIDAIQKCPGVPSLLLDPRASWSDVRVYDKKAKDLAALFAKNALTFA